MHARAPLAVAALLAPALLFAVPESPGGSGVPAPDAGAPEVAYVLPASPVDGADVTALLQYLTTNHQNRAAGKPQYIPAQGWIASKLSSYGMVVEVDPYKANTFNGVTYPHVFGGSRGSPSGAANVCGYYPAKDLTKRWVVLGAHYDVVETTAQGAYDNGAGTALVLALAQDLIQNNALSDRVLVACLWGGEEDGLVGSSVWVNTLPAPEIVQLYVNLDMAGLNWPGETGSLMTAITYYGPEQLQPVSGAKMKAYSRGVRVGLGLSQSYFTETAAFLLTSDNVAIGARNVPYFGFANFAANAYRNANDPGESCYHRMCDTYANLVAHQGSQQLLDDGFEAVGALIYRHLADLPATMEFRLP